MCDLTNSRDPLDMTSPGLAHDTECFADLHRIPVSETDTPEENLLLMACKLIHMTKALSVLMTTDDSAAIECCERLSEDIHRHEKLATAGLIRQASLTHEKVFKTVMYLPSRMERLSILIGNILHCCRVRIDEALQFSEKAQNELSDILGAVLGILDKTGRGLLARNRFLLEQIKCESQNLEKLVEAARCANWERMQAGICPPQRASLYVEILDCFRNVNESVIKIYESLLTLVDSELQSVVGKKSAHLKL